MSYSWHPHLYAEPAGIDVLLKKDYDARERRADLSHEPVPEKQKASLSA